MKRQLFPITGGRTVFHVSRDLEVIQLRHLAKGLPYTSLFSQEARDRIGELYHDPSAQVKWRDQYKIRRSLVASYADEDLKGIVQGVLPELMRQEGRNMTEKKKSRAEEELLRRGSFFCVRDLDSHVHGPHCEGFHLRTTAPKKLDMSLMTRPEVYEQGYARGVEDCKVYVETGVSFTAEHSIAGVEQSLDRKLEAMLAHEQAAVRKAVSDVVLAVNPDRAMVDRYQTVPFSRVVHEGASDIARVVGESLITVTLSDPVVSSALQGLKDNATRCTFISACQKISGTMMPRIVFFRWVMEMMRNVLQGAKPDDLIRDLKMYGWDYQAQQYAAMRGIKEKNAAVFEVVYCASYVLVGDVSPILGGYLDKINTAAFNQIFIPPKRRRARIKLGEISNMSVSRGTIYKIPLRGDLIYGPTPMIVVIRIGKGRYSSVLVWDEADAKIRFMITRGAYEWDHLRIRVSSGIPSGQEGVYDCMAGLLIADVTDRFDEFPGARFFEADSPARGVCWITLWHTQLGPLMTKWISPTWNQHGLAESLKAFPQCPIPAVETDIASMMDGVIKIFGHEVDTYDPVTFQPLALYRMCFCYSSSFEAKTGLVLCEKCYTPYQEFWKENEAMFRTFVF